MNVKEITEQYLKANGYDGLYNENGECGCERGDLMPCDCSGIEDCEPAMQHYCPACGESIFVPISSLEKLCRKLDEKQKSKWREVSGIFADERPRASTYEAG